MELQKPKSQRAEVLHELINYYPYGVSRREFMINCHVLNAPDQIHHLRRKGLGIQAKEVKVKNKYNREVRYCSYVLVDKEIAINVYNEMNNEI